MLRNVTRGEDGVRKVMKSSRGANEPEMVESDNGLVLTPHGRWQIVQGLAKPVIRYIWFLLLINYRMWYC